MLNFGLDDAPWVSQMVEAVETDTACLDLEPPTTLTKESVQLSAKKAFGYLPTGSHHESNG